MGSHSKQRRRNRILRTPGAIIASLLLLLFVESLLLQKGVIGAEKLRAGTILCCLLSGAVGAALWPKGERTNRLFLLAAAVPSFLLFISGLSCAPAESRLRCASVHALCLLLPCILAFLLGSGRKGSGIRKRKRRF